MSKINWQIGTCNLDHCSPFTIYCQ